MPGPISKQSRDLANVRLQLKSGKTRGSNPRPLSPEEVCALEARRDQLHSEMAGRRCRRLLLLLSRGRERVNNITTKEGIIFLLADPGKSDPGFRCSAKFIVKVQRLPLKFSC